MQSAKRETIVVLDDERDTLDLCNRIFRDTYDVIIAASGHEARDLVAGRELALALVDQRMPEITGLEFLVGFAKTHPLASRVVMTGYTDLEDIVALINEGKIHGFVLKPWNNHQVRVTVDREVENFRRARTIAELDAKLRQEHSDMMVLLRELDPDFQVPQSNDQLKETKNRLRTRVTDEVEKLFLTELLDAADGNVSRAAREAKINRTFLYRLLKRHGLPDEPAA